MAKELNKYQKRCEDCASLVVKNGEWLCDECFCQACKDIDECPEGVELEDIQELEQKAKANKIDHGASAEKKKDSKPRTVKISDEKQMLFGIILGGLNATFGENVQVLKENKLISVQIDGKTFKVDIIEQRNKK